MKGFVVIIIALLSAIYLLNPTFGVLELIPDNMPLVGNLDEATAMAVLLACARYFGFDFSRFFGKRGEDVQERDIVDVDEVRR
jgi:hypothetical protein